MANDKMVKNSEQAMARERCGGSWASLGGGVLAVRFRRLGGRP